jgi:iron complex outermembrane receptor protein
LLTGGAAVVLSSAAMAQQLAQGPATEPQAALLEEIVVTAEKRPERLQDAPLAVSVVSGAKLADLQIQQSAGLTSAVPSLSFQQGANPQNTNFRVRGIGTALFGVGTVSSVAVVVDGVPLARQSQSFFNMADIEHIEVLSGPQGTLFGEGASAGVINVVTERPSPEFSGSVGALGAQGDEYRVDSSVSGPLRDSVGARLTGYYHNTRGILPEVGTDNFENGAQDWGTRAKLMWDATNDLTFLFTASFDHNSDSCCAPVLVNSTNPTMIKLNPGVTISPANRNVVDDALTYSDSKQQLYSLQGDLHLDTATITSITGYQKYSLANNNEGDSIRNPTPVYVGGASGPAFAQWNLQGGTFDLQQASQELRISGVGERVNYVAGVYLQDLHIDRNFSRRRAYCAAGTAAQLGTPCTPNSFTSYNTTGIFRSDIEAAFSQLDYRLTQNFKALAGLRVQHESVAASGAPGGYNGSGAIVAGDGLFGSAVAGKQSVSDTAVSGKGGFQYEFSSSAQAYATYTRGFKGAGFNISPNTNYATQQPVRTEHANAYEVGYKAEYWHRALTLQADVFLEKYADLQVQTSIQDPVTGVLVATQTNAGNATSKGFEVNATLHSHWGLSLNTNATLAKTRFDLNGVGCPLQFQSAAVTVTGAPPSNQCYLQQGQALLNVRDGQLPSSPQWRAGFAPRYEHSLGSSLVGFGQFNVNYQSSEVFDPSQDPLLKQNGYTLVDFSLGLASSAGNYNVTFFVKNLFNEFYYTNMQHAQFLATAAKPSDVYAFLDKESQRYFGASLQMKF